MPTYEEMRRKTDKGLCDILQAGMYPDPDNSEYVRMSPALAAAVILLHRKDQLIQALAAREGNS